MILTIGLLTLSNVFMTLAWYGHLKSLKESPIWIVIFMSWGIAFFEYCLQVPANRWGHEHFNLGQLKILQEIISMFSVFSGFVLFYMKEDLRLDYLWASLCMVAAAFFIFRGS